jgi:uncharacterized protein
MAARAPTLGRRLRERVADFCAYARAEGLPLGTGAELDLASAIDVIAVLDRPQMRDAVGVTLAKSPDQLELIGRIFDRFFHASGGGRGIPSPGAKTASLAASRPGRTEARFAPAERTHAERPVVSIPVGTYSLSAPGAAHPLTPLSERQHRAVRRGARRFRREMATSPGRRSVRSRRGDVDLRDTIRHGLQYGGEWTELRHRRPRPTRAEFVVLWDVSGSMREHESRAFGLVHALETVSRTSRVFAFSTRVEEVTAEVRRYGYRRAVSTVGRKIDRADGGTQIAAALREFDARYGSALRERATLVVLSDGWDLSESEDVGKALERLRRRAHRVVWITPYTRQSGFAPRVGALRSALPHIDRLLGPEDFESRWPLRPFDLSILPASAS